jgi:hypothetical protein
MGLDADLVAIGPFKEAIADYLEYPGHYYQNTRPGVQVITSVFLALTTDQSHGLAKAFGIDAWDFNQHEINPFHVDLELLMSALEITSDDNELKQFLALRDAGFKFFYCPNG